PASRSRRRREWTAPRTHHLRIRRTAVAAAGMTAVFKHGALRLYLLKLLGEQPRHGYEVISLLEDRFLGLYAPSAGTVYPPLAKLEADGLVEHEVSEGRKVYALTSLGREELARNAEELASLERDLTASVSDLARDVRRQ